MKTRLNTPGWFYNLSQTVLYYGVVTWTVIIECDITACFGHVTWRMDYLESMRNSVLLFPHVGVDSESLSVNRSLVPSCVTENGQSTGRKKWKRMVLVKQANHRQRKEMMMGHKEVGGDESADIHSAYDNSTQPALVCPMEKINKSWALKQEREREREATALCVETRYMWMYARWYVC